MDKQATETIEEPGKRRPPMRLKKRKARSTPRKLLYPNLEIPQILAWADAYHTRHGKWPSRNGGAVPECPGNNWCAIDQALKKGVRGLPGDSSLAKLLQRHRNKANYHRNRR